MSRYICKLIDKDGRSREIAREGASESKIKELYSGGDLFLVSIRESKGEIPKARKAFKREDVRELTIMLSALLGSGLVLKEALAIAAEISPRGKGGRSLSGELLEAIGPAVVARAKKHNLVDIFPQGLFHDPVEKSGTGGDDRRGLRIETAFDV